MGLAALTFASVAGASVSATSTNANAAKHTTKKVAKKVTYKVTNGSLDQKVVYTATGSNAVYSKPGTVKGAKVVASKATMASLANSKKASDQFMAYQEVTTSKGAKYYKVVSFDKKIRGYVYASGIQSVGTTTSDLTVSSDYLYNGTTAPAKSVYLKAARFFDAPYGSVFGAKLVKFDTNLFDYRTDAFYIDGAKKVSRTGDVYYHVVDSRNSYVSGWVNSANLALNATDAGTLYSDANAVHVTVVNQNTKATVFTKDYSFNAATGSAADTNSLSATNLETKFNADIKNAGYNSYDADGSAALIDGLPVKNLNTVKNGSNVTVYVTPNTTAAKQNVKVNFFLVSNDDKTGLQQTATDVTSVLVGSSSNVAGKLTTSLASVLQGRSFDTFNYSNAINTLFASNGALYNKIVVSNDTTANNGTYDFNAALTAADKTNAQFANNDKKFSAVSSINVYFTKESSNTDTSVNGTVTTQPATSSTSYAKDSDFFTTSK